MWNGLPPMDAPGATLLGEIDVSRNGSPPGGVAADLRAPSTTAEAAAAPGAAMLTNHWVVIGLLGFAFLALNARDRK